MFSPSSPSVITLLCTVGLMATAPVSASPLPLDVIGLYISAAKPVTGGSGYRVNDLLTLPGGATLSVSKVAADTSVAEVSVAQPIMHACLTDQPLAAQQAAGSGTGATFALSVQRPTAYATRRLSSCYTGPALTVNRSDNNAAQPIAFLADGALDTQAIDHFTAPPERLRTYTTHDSGVTPRVSLWNDQGGGANDATQTKAAERPTFTVDRLHGNSRAIMFDAHGGAPGWDPANTFLSLPAGVKLTANRFTLAVIAEATSAFTPVGFITVGEIAGKNAGLEFARYSPRPTACDGAGDNAYAAVVPTETPAIILCTADARGKTIDMLGTSTTTTWGNDTQLSGGSLGLSADKRSGLVNMSAAIVVPWPVDNSTRTALQASLQQAFALPTASNALIVVLGDSHSDGTGAPFQQGWTQQMLKALGREDVQLVNAAIYGGRLAAGVEQWKKLVRPNLEASNVAHKIVILQGGYNDQQYGLSTEQIIATYQRGAALAHKAGAKAVCVANVLRNADPRANSVMAQVNKAIRAPLQGCDAVIDWASVPAFNQQSGSYPPPYFAFDRIHLSAQGQALQARMAAAVIAKLLL